MAQVTKAPTINKWVTVVKNPITHLGPNRLSCTSGPHANLLHFWPSFVAATAAADPLWVKTVYNTVVILLSWGLVCSLRLTNPTNQVPLVVTTKERSARSEWCPPTRAGTSLLA